MTAASYEHGARPVGRPTQFGVEDHDNLVELARLERMLRRASGFRLAFAVVNHPTPRDRLVDAVRGHLGNSRIAELTLSPTMPEGAVSAIRRIAADGAEAIFVCGLESLSPSRERATAIFALNLNRDSLWQTVRVPVVFWAPDVAVRDFANQAVDLAGPVLGWGRELRGSVGHLSGGDR